MSIVVLSIGIGSTRIAAAQERAHPAIESRIANFREIGTAYKNIGDELKRTRRDLPRIQESAQLIKSRSADMLQWFPPGSEPPEAHKSWLDKIVGWIPFRNKLTLPSEAESHARRAVWTNRAKFEQAYTHFKAEAERMQQAAQGGNAATISAQFRKLGESCKACHDVFREKLD